MTVQTQEQAASAHVVQGSQREWQAGDGRAPQYCFVGDTRLSPHSIN